MPTVPNSLEVALTHVHDNPDLANFGPPVSSAAIEKASGMLSIPFSPSYITFLWEVGVGSFNGTEIYGIVESNVAGTSIPNLVWINNDLRRSQHWPRHYLVVASSGDGGWYCLDTSCDFETREFPIILCDPYANVVRVTHPSFGDYFLDAVTFV